MVQAEPDVPERKNSSGNQAAPGDGWLDPVIWNQALSGQASPDSVSPDSVSPGPASEVPAPRRGRRPAPPGRRPSWSPRRIAGRLLTAVPDPQLGRTLPRVSLGVTVVMLLLACILVSQHVSIFATRASARSQAPQAAAGPAVIPLSPALQGAASPPSPSSAAHRPTKIRKAPPRKPARTRHATGGGSAGPGQAPPPGVALPPLSQAPPGNSAPARRAPAHARAPARQAPPPATIVATGHVTCLSGSAVVGVWMVGLAGGSGWAAWTSSARSPEFASFNHRISNGTWAVHVGCGGSPASWHVATYSGLVSGTPHDFTCDDIQGQAQYGECWT